MSPTSHWTVSCNSAVIAATKASGLAWDSVVGGFPSDGAQPDPYCQAQLDNFAIDMTSTKQDTLEPHWNESLAPKDSRITASVLTAASSRLRVRVIDDDTGLLSDEICSVPVSLAAVDFTAGEKTYTDQQSCNQLVLGLTCAD